MAIRVFNLDKGGKDIENKLLLSILTTSKLAIELLNSEITYLTIPQASLTKY
jgi:hypothetical protein